MTADMPWRLSHRGARAAVALADRHYSRQQPGTSQFVPPGRCLVLLGYGFPALWVTLWQRPEYTDHDWPGAWVMWQKWVRPDGPPPDESRWQGWVPPGMQDDLRRSQ